MTFDRYDVVVVPFPFTDINATLRRPAIILSNPHDFGFDTGQNLMAMVTRAKRSAWKTDLHIAHPEEAGLSDPSYIRLKLFNIENHFVLRKLGHLANPDIENLKLNIEAHFEL